MKPDSSTAPAGATALTTTANKNGPDSDIVAAFEKRRAAYAAFRALPGHEQTAEDRPLWDEIDLVEGFFVLADAQTPRGAELQLWAALSHLVDPSEPEQDARTYAADLDYFVGIKDSLDWPVQLVVSTLQSLRAMGNEA